MSLKEKIMNDMKTAMKERNALKTGVLRMLKAEIMKKENEKPGAEVHDDDVVALTQKLIKQRNEAAEQFEKGGRPELAQKEKDEAAILENYLPPRVSDEEIRAVVDEVIAETGAGDMSAMGRVMGGSMKKLKETGKVVDGNQVKEIVKKALVK